MEQVNSKALYNSVYDTSTVNYGSIGLDVSERYLPFLKLIKNYIQDFNLNHEACILEVGCGLAHLHLCHPNWKGIEYSRTAVEQAKSHFGSGLNIVEGDATKLCVDSETVDFYFSFAALEHVPEVHLAFAEIERVVRPGGYAMLAPAWNCRAWTVKKLQQRPYNELKFSEKLEKFSIPVRNTLAYRFFFSVPFRIKREIAVLLGERKLALDYTPLRPDFSLWDRYPHISDDDAFVSMDSHAAILYFLSRGWQVVSHNGILSRLFCRGEEVVVRKPSYSSSSGRV